MIESTAITKTSAFQLKGSSFTLTVLQLLNLDTDSFSKQLADTVKRAPRFFHNTPIIIDLQKISRAIDLVDFATINHQLRKHSIIPVGVIGGNEEQHQQALIAGLAVLPNTKVEVPEVTPIKQVKQSIKQSTKLKPSEQQQLQHIPSLIIKQPVRSGQQLYAKKCDLIILSSVSAGAELLADGNIHVYGALRGRALAGANGDQTARIFCQELEAELVSVAGFYWVNEDLQMPESHKGIQIYLEDERLRIGTL
jgi:septum site-determining protein MinC